MTKQLLVIFFLLVLLFLRVSLMGWGNPEEKSIDFEPTTGYFSSLRDSMSAQIGKLLPSPESGLLGGMLLGSKESLPPDFKKALTNTSTIHMVVASGQNLSLVAGFLMGFVSVLGRKKTVALSMIVTFFYALLAGFQIPIIRAWIMFVFAASSQLFNREGDGGFILFLTGLLMLLINPSWVYSISFQLSFLATLAVVVLAPVLVERVHFLPDIIKEDLVVSLSASVLTYPVIAQNFHQVSIIGIFVNTLVLWTVGPVMITGALAMFISYLSLFLGQVIALIPGVLLTYFVYVINFFNQSWVVINVPRVSMLVWIGYYVLILGIYLWLKSLSSDRQGKSKNNEEPLELKNSFG